MKRHKALKTATLPLFGTMIDELEEMFREDAEGVIKTFGEFGLIDHSSMLERPAKTNRDLGTVFESGEFSSSRSPTGKERHTMEPEPGERAF